MWRVAHTTLLAGGVISAGWEMCFPGEETPGSRGSLFLRAVTVFRRSRWEMPTWTASSAGGVEVHPGGVVQISGEAAALTLRLAAGKASLSGMAHRGEIPAAGAMVLVVPALADAADLADRITRTETNSDGSFTLSSLTPGPYIVVVLESGWSVNWRDQSTLAGYLMQGVPVDLKPASKPKLDVTAALP